MVVVGEGVAASAGIVPHSGQRSGVARRSYPQVGQNPRRDRSDPCAPRTARVAGQIEALRISSQCGTVITTPPAPGIPLDSGFTLAKPNPNRFGTIGSMLREQRAPAGEFRMIPGRSRAVHGVEIGAASLTLEWIRDHGRPARASEKTHWIHPSADTPPCMKSSGANRTTTSACV
jgi:hypothetical protein